MTITVTKLIWLITLCHKANLARMLQKWYAPMRKFWSACVQNTRISSMLITRVTVVADAVNSL
jgi:hypothetical protein